jgi:uncharacterized delta-60 repeat protein
MKNTAGGVFCVLVFFVFGFVGGAFDVSAAPGDLDPTFGVQGRRIILIPNTQPGGLIWNTAEDIVVQPDGKILVAGAALHGLHGFDYTVTRFNADGSLDSGFAAGGVFRYDFTGSDDKIYGIAVQPDGKIVVAGQAYLGVIDGSGADTAFGLMRLNPNGSFDASFGTGGIVITNFFSSLDYATEVALQPDGKIIATGNVTQGGVNNGSTYDFAAVRYNPNGSPDTSFGGGDGIVFIDFNGSGDLAQTSVLQPDGKIVLAGWVFVSPAAQYDYGLARLNPDGSLDTSFDGDGKVLTTFGAENELARGMALAPGGKIVVTGDSYIPPPIVGQSGNWNITVARYNPDGSLDASFDGDGRFVYDSQQGDGNEHSQDTVVQPDGKILLVGGSHLIQETNPSVAHRDMMIFRLNVDGSFDGGFGSGGKTFTDFGIFNQPGPPEFGSGRTSEVGISAAIVLQPDGKIVAACDSWLKSVDRRLGIARFENDSFYAGNHRMAFDVDGDRRTDIAVFRPSEGNWYILQSADNSFRALHFGQDGDTLAPADYDGDRKTDIAVVRDDVWYILQSSNNNFRAESWGTPGTEFVVPADYDGDGKADLAFFRFSGNTINDVNYFQIRQSSDGAIRTVQWANQSVPTPRPADYDGDGKADIASYNCFPVAGQTGAPRCEWAILQSSTGTGRIEHFGNGFDTPLPPADYDGDGRSDIAVFRSSERVWYLLQSTAGFGALQYGLETDAKRPGDYDGDGKADFTVWRPSDGYWYLLRSQQGFTGFQFGSSGDVPVPNSFVR